MTQTWFPRFEISTMNSSGALLVLDGPGLQAAPGLALGAPDGNAATDGLLVNDSRDRNQRGNRPPENEAQLQYGLRQIQVRADPGESAPDQGCAENAEQPAGRGDDPERKVAVRGLRGLLSTQANAHLRTRREVRRHGDGHTAKGT